jgi:hypothetical protein
MTFAGWPAEALEFYEGLAADNTKTYWTRHKAEYEEHVLRPMTELLEELAPEFGDPKIFRPYRDVRFSKDKTPYKTHIGALVGRGYIQLSAAGLAVGSGMYHLDAGQLDRYRREGLAGRALARHPGGQGPGHRRADRRPPAYRLARRQRGPAVGLTATGTSRSVALGSRSRARNRVTRHVP